MQQNELLLDKINAVLESKYFGVLATLGHRYPYCTLVGFASTQDGRRILFATRRDTEKFRNIQNNPYVSLLVDDRTNRSADISSTFALTALGRAQEVVADDLIAYRNSYLTKNPHMKDFLFSDDCALLSILVAKYILVSNFENVEELVLE